MAAHVRTVVIPEVDRRELQRRARSKGAPARVVARARVVLLAAEGVPEALRDRVLELTGPRARGRGHADLTRHHCPDLTPLRRAAPAVGDVQLLHRPRTRGQDPRRRGPVDVVGLYLHPPEQAVVLCVDEKPQLQALERTAPVLPVRPGQPKRQTFDYLRHGTTTLFAALEVATGKVTDACTQRHRHQEVGAFLRQAAAYPGRELHVVVDTYATPMHPAVRAWLRRHPRVRLHFTPTSGSWLNLVEVFFSIITRQALRRGNYPTVADLIAAIQRFIDAWNGRCAPFTWTKDPDTVTAKATDPRRRKTQTTSVTGTRTTPRREPSDEIPLR
jgi:hypothetical protein